jgi:hypothetical protein
MQDIIALFIVVVAAGFLIRRAMRHFSGQRAGSCGSCASCPADTPTLVSISNLPHGKAQRREDIKT